MSNFIICNDAFLQLRRNRWLFSNPRSRSHVYLSSAAVAVISQGNCAFTKEEWVEKLHNVTGAEATCDFYAEQGLHNDHSGINNVSGSELSGADLFLLLVKRFLIIEQSGQDYQNYFSSLTSILDRNHLGSFHQRVGQFLTIEKRLREERWRWWHNQKFSEDGLKVNAGPYKYIQEEFVNKYFNNTNIKGMKILDFGCGNGFYSAKLADFGAEVTALDTSKELIDLARKNFSTRAEFVLVSEDESIPWLQSRAGKFDAVFMQDVLLLLLKPESGKPIGVLPELLRSIRNCLGLGGKLFTMEPNAAFFLAGRYGDPQNPYAIVSEYQNSVFNVVPNLSEIVNTMSAAGFSLAEYQIPKSSSLNPDLAGKNFCNNFAIWDFMCFLAVEKGD